MKQLLKIVLALLVCIFSVEVVNVVHARKLGKSDLESILLGPLPSKLGLNCTSSIGGNKHADGFEMKSRFGACSKFKADRGLRFGDIFRHDQARLEFWKSRFASSSEVTAATSLPSHSSVPIGSSIYHVTVGLGTPKTDLSLAFDTGSGLTWTQCEPCSLGGSGSCFTQVDPIFNPANSSTYSKIGCESAACSPSIISNPICLTESCAYNQSYLDKSFTAGFLSTETVTLTPNHTFSDFLFGCGQQNEGLFKGIAGVLGLDKSSISIVSQASSAFGKYFSYCMPDIFSDSTGHLTFGKAGNVSLHPQPSTNISYTPLLTADQLPGAYLIELQSISVAGKQLSIPPTVFSTLLGGIIIDSGTTITSLPPTAYSALLDAFTESMDRQNHSAIPSPVSGFDGCYNFTGISNILIPIITLSFNGGAQMNMHTWGTIVPVSVSDDGKLLAACLAFASSEKTGLSILGNLQQETYDIVYDIDGGKIGFGADGC